MELAVIVLAILALGCFYEYEHLTNNNIRHDETKYLVMAIICALAIFVIMWTLPHLFSHVHEHVGE